MFSWLQALRQGTALVRVIYKSDPQIVDWIMVGLIDILNLFIHHLLGCIWLEYVAWWSSATFCCVLSCVYYFVFLFFFWTAAVQLIQVFSRHCGPPQAEPAVAL
jgi:hypothetical protein